MSNFCTLKPYLVGISDPLVTQVWLRANGIERDSDMYVGATEYGLLIKELIEDSGAPSNEYPLSLKFGKHPCLHVVNAGTDDQMTVAARNRDTRGAIDFKDKLNRLRVA